MVPPRAYIPVRPMEWDILSFILNCMLRNICARVWPKLQSVISLSWFILQYTPNEILYKHVLTQATFNSSVFSPVGYRWSCVC